MNRFQPEGKLICTEENIFTLKNSEAMRAAYEQGTILEARALMCTAAHDLIVDIPDAKAIIPRVEGALGVAEGTTRDIAMLSRVGKPVCFVITAIDNSGKIPCYTLSRAKAQLKCCEHYLFDLKPGDVIPARVTHMEPFGAFVDIGCGISSLIPIDAISVSRISHPHDRFYNGQYIYAAVKCRDECGRICLTHKELLGTWEQNCSRFEVGSTVQGIVRSVESYGIFIELAPNLAGLSEPRTGISAGQNVSVSIKSIKPDRMKLKLAIVDIFSAPQPSPSLEYFITAGHIDHWTYSPEGCSKVITTDF